MFRFSLSSAVWTCLILAASAARCGAQDQPIDADILLRGGSLLDGGGGPAVEGDVALREGRIVAVGRFKTGRIGREIDCRGLVVCPGFIDLHNHSDFPILEKKTRPAANYLTQGCTTLVTGNCGGGQADAAVFLKQIDELGSGVNVAHLLPHGAIRSRVMGDGKRAPTAEELDEMLGLFDQGMKDGAFGMSTGLIYVPGAYAETPELVELAKVVARHGGLYTSHIRNEGRDLLASVEEALTIGREADVRVHVSHFKATGRPYWGSVRLAGQRIEEERGKGRQVTADQYPYVASSTSLQAMLLPAALREGGDEAMVRRAKDPSGAAEMRKAIVASLEERNQLQIAAYQPRPEFAGRMLTELAEEEGQEPADLALDMIAAGGAAVVSFSMSEDDVRQVMQWPWVATASDGGVKVEDGTKPHPRSFGTFTRKIGRYSLAEKVLPLERAVRSASGLPADILGLKDRGYLKTGFAADVVVFDPRSILDQATYAAPFLHSTGIQFVFVNGELAVEDERPTGKLAGVALRKQAATESPAHNKGE